MVIVGGGASGTLTTVNLLRALAGTGTACRIVLLDRLGRHARGTAYSTTDDTHLLNVTAARMSAFPGDPRHFLRWARSVGVELTDDTYAPRRLYGRYLTETLDQAIAAAPSITVTRVTATATAITELHPRTEPDSGHALRVHLGAGGRIDADLVVMATGNRPPGDPVPGLRWSPRYVADPWRPGALRHRTGRAVCVGTGLTMIDVALTLTRDPSTVVYAVSRHGLTPRPHDTAAAVCPAPAAPPPDGPLRLVEAIRWLNTVIARCPDWRVAMDLVRPYVPDLWRRLPDADRRIFLDRLARYWEVHRHRMPEATARRVDALRASGRLRLVTGAVRGAEMYGDAVEVTIAGPGGDHMISADWLVNCTGPRERLTPDGGPYDPDDPLFTRLITSGLALPGPMNIGLATTPEGALLTPEAAAHPRLYTLGPPRRGALYESTAIPEIRCQAQTLATHLAAALTQPAATPHAPAPAH
ncbi:MAG TPA: FAD/NAD(P)-binding protein [Streptosporangiaceae bacterium]